MANNKQVKVDLVFGTDVNETKAQVQSLQSTLQNVIKLSGAGSNLFDDASIRKAGEAALELEQHLAKAVNINTGKLDLSRFSASLKSSNKTLSEYANTLMSVGSTGQQAFLQLAKAIATADAPVARVNKKIVELGTTLKNTAKWQISSSILHGFMGALQSAYGYAEDLNESLNNIRIVTGYNIDQMAGFAKEANKAAKALSATTTEYTNASLIYYQQGLSDAEVKERAAITVKMANVSRESAESVSNQLTSVWNNFDNGTKSLEYYADAMTALGAATASSTKEISAGLNKFAAVADTVGLSYEYAASALATVTATTRESAEVVGTAFKTLFARVQDLELGKTLDDGTTLGSYSQALAAVGINIKDANGGLKDMDQILSEMGGKWSSLSKDTQVALAQSVAGTRQYAQLIALMDNWGYFQKNLDVALNSQGTLNEQAEIYAESWEAAQDRVTAAAEKIYSSLLDDEFFIDLLNGLEKVLEAVSGMIDGFGGLKGIITTVGSVLLTMFANQLPNALKNLQQNFMVITGQGKKLTAQVQNELAHSLKMAQADSTVSNDYRIQAEGIATINAMKQQLILETNNLSESERLAYENRIRAVESLYEEIRALEKKKEAAEAAMEASVQESMSSGQSNVSQVFRDFYDVHNKTSNSEKRVRELDARRTNITSKKGPLNQAEQSELSVLNIAFESETKKRDEHLDEMVRLDEQIQQLKQTYKLTTEEVDLLIDRQGKISTGSELWEKINSTIKETTQRFQGLVEKSAVLDNLTTSVHGQANAWRAQKEEITRYLEEQGKSPNAVKAAAKDVEIMQSKMKAYIEQVQQLAADNGIELDAQAIENMNVALNNMNVENIEDGIQAFETFADIVETQVTPELMKVDEELDELRDSMQNMNIDPSAIKNMEVAANKSALAKTQILNAEEGLRGLGQEGPKHVYGLTETFTKFGAAVMSVSTLISSVQNNIAILTDESATGLEKVGAALAIVTTLMTTATTVSAAYQAITKNQIMIDMATALSKGAVGAATAILTKLKIAETSAVYANTIAWLSNPIGLMATIIMGVVAAATLLIVGIKALTDAYNKDANAAKQAQETAKNLADTYNDIKSAYDEMISTMSNYKDAKSALNDLTIGTQEYEEALLKANQAAQELIRRYDDLEYIIDSNGLIQISEESLKNAQQQEFQNVQKAQLNANRTDYEARMADNKAKETELLRTEIKEKNLKDHLNDIGAKMAAGWEMGMSTGEPMAALGGAIANMFVGAAEAITNNASSTTMEKSTIKQLQAAQQEYGNMSHLSEDEYKNYLKTQVGISSEALIDSLTENRVETEKLIAEMNQNTKAMQVLDKQLAFQALNINEKVQDSKYTEDIVATVSKFMSDDRQEALDKLNNDNWGESGDKNSVEAKDAFAEYAAAAGLTDVTFTDVVGEGDDRTFKYTDANGKEQEISVTAMRSAVADQRARNKANERGNAIADIYNDFNETEMAAVSAAVNKDYNKLNIGQIKDGNFGVSTASDLKLTLDDLAAMGYTGDDAEAKFNADMQTAQANAQAEWTKTLNMHTSGVNTAMNAIATSTNDNLKNISYGTLKAYGDMLEGFGNSTEATNFSNALTDIMEENSEDAEAIMQAATGIDWSQGKIALEQLNGQLYDMGIDITQNSELWNKFQETVNKMSFSVVHQNLEIMRQTLATIGKLAKDVSFGDIISDEDYKQLTDIDGSLKKDFVMTADGYMYVGEGNLQNKAKDATMSQLAKAKSNNTKAKAAAEAFSNAVWSDGTKEDWRGLAEGTDADWQLADMAKTLGDSASSWGEHVKALGYDQAYIKELGDTLSSSDATEDQKDAARDKLKEFYGQIIELQNQVNSGNFDDKRAEEVAASQMSAAQLDKAVESKAISSDTAETFKKVLSEAANADKDIFRNVNKELEDVEFNLSKIEKAKENAFGPDKIDLIKQETEQLQQQIEAEKERQALLQEKLFGVKDKEGNKVKEGLQDKLKKDYSFLQFNEDGSISNYDDLYTNLSEDEWEAAKKAIDDYEQSLAEVRESELTVSDLYSEANSKNLEAYEAADEALSRYTEKLQHHNNVLEHYKNLSALIGKENDYKSMGEILKGQANISSNSYKVSEKNHQMYQDEVTNWETLMNDTKNALTSAKETGNEDEATRLETLLNTYTKNWEDAQAKSRDAQDAMLSDLQTWAESEKAILDNTLADLGHTLETTLTGGQTFDELSTQMERAQSLQEEYLTTTNQIYETTKMMRTAQQAIDTSSNVVAKEKLKNFITETKSLQEQGKLSRYELDMQQAKYDLLVAEIALEEAQNAKSTVRLQRDAEGNFGYVYTADAGAVSDAQQQYDDAENALYNKGLEGANDYSQKSQQTMQEMVEALKTIQTNYQNGMYTSEQEYEAAMLETKEHYLQKLQDYGMLYNTAIGADNRVMAEAWSSSFADMTLDAENWDNAIEDYISGAKNAFNDWGDVVATIKETTGSDLTDLANKVSNVTTASNELTTALFGVEGGDGGIFGKLKEGLADVVTAIQKALNGETTPDTNGAAAASGGLTSNWGPAGKMLMVHESELILNKDQTNKFFDNLAIMENILSTIDSYTLGQQFGGILQSPAYNSTSSGTLEQSVHIEASFPSVTNRNEIEEAFNNLVNKASQYANRK